MSGRARPQRSRKSTGKSTAVRKIPQPHGGALNSGGTPGNRGNPLAPGRPASAIRQLCRQSFEKRIAVLETIGDSATSDDGDRIKAIDILGKYGLDARTQLAVEDVKERLRATLAAIREVLPPVDAERVIARIRGEWAA